MCSGLGEKIFKAAVLLTPFYRLYDEKLYDKYPLLSIVSCIAPNKIIHMLNSENGPEYEAKWGHVVNDHGQVKLVTPMTAVSWVTMQAKAKEVIT